MCNKDDYGKYDELCSKIHFKYRSNLNLPSDLKMKYTVKFYICETFIQFNSMIIYDQLCRKVPYNFKSNLNLPSDLNENMQQILHVD